MAPSPEAMELDARPDGSDIQDMMFSPSLVSSTLNPHSQCRWTLTAMELNPEPCTLNTRLNVNRMVSDRAGFPARRVGHPGPETSTPLQLQPQNPATFKAKQLNPKPLKVVELDTRADGSEIQDIMLGITGGRSVPRVFVAGPPPPPETETPNP